MTLIDQWLDPVALGIVLGGTLLATLLRCGPAETRLALSKVGALVRPAFDPAQAKAELAKQIGAQADRVADGMDRAPVPMQKVVVTGFSQGGMMSFALAVRHPERVTTALPIGGMLFEELRPEAAGSTKIRAFHGTIDQVVPLAPTEQAVEALKEQGWDAELTTYEGVGHTVSPGMRKDYTAALKQACGQ